MSYRPQGTSSVAENGGHIRTTSEITPPLQASPITSASSSQAPPPPTTSPLPAPPSSHGDSSSVTSPEPPPSSTPSQSPGNNQTESSDSVNTDEIIDKTNEGITSTISSKNDPNEHTSSIGEPTTYEKVCILGVACLQFFTCQCCIVGLEYCWQLWQWLTGGSPGCDSPGEQRGERGERGEWGKCVISDWRIGSKGTVSFFW